jgi:phosphocarrier protein
MESEYLIIDEAGLHARPASLLVKEASKFDNEIYIKYGTKKLDLKSILAVLSLGVPQNATIKIEVVGENADAILDNLEKVLKENKLI